MGVDVRRKYSRFARLKLTVPSGFRNEYLHIVPTWSHMTYWILLRSIDSISMSRKSHDAPWKNPDLHEGLQGIGDSQLSSLRCIQQVQICRHFLQWRHGTQGRHLHDILGQSHLGLLDTPKVELLVGCIYILLDIYMLNLFTVWSLEHSRGQKTPHQTSFKTTTHQK